MIPGVVVKRIARAGVQHKRKIVVGMTKVTGRDILRDLGEIEFFQILGCKFNLSGPRREGAVLKALDHPAIVRLLELGIEDEGSAVFSELTTMTHPDTLRIKHLQASYYAMIEQIDHEFGQLIGFLDACGQRDNTVVVVEHDEDTIRAADHIIDFGPGPGVRGGNNRQTLTDADADGYNVEGGGWPNTFLDVANGVDKLREIEQDGESAGSAGDAGALENLESRSQVRGGANGRS